MTGMTSTKKWAAIVAAWAMLGVMYAGPIYYEVRSEGMDHAAWRVFSWGILTWLAWAPLTPAIVWLARKFSLVEGAWKRNVLIHLPGFLLISALHSAAGTAITLSIKPFDNMGTPMELIRRFGTRRDFERAVVDLQSALYEGVA